ncbi:hypothetical protein [Ruegeria atlantica]|uniref:hypothetical protein n=1 Tax=Ruegeria atlantica TaxID=81569 RepID=UPI00249591D4|nr:hypothetical protein [Ruegeria atlantica]
MKLESLGQFTKRRNRVAKHNRSMMSKAYLTKRKKRLARTRARNSRCQLNAFRAGRLGYRPLRQRKLEREADNSLLKLLLQVEKEETRNKPRG